MLRASIELIDFATKFFREFGIFLIVFLVGGVIGVVAAVVSVVAVVVRGAVHTRATSLSCFGGQWGELRRSIPSFAEL